MKKINKNVLCSPLLILGSHICFSMFSYAQTDANVNTRTNEPTNLGDIIIEGSGLEQTSSAMSRPNLVLSGNKLVLSADSTIGATLNQYPGIHSTHFGIGADRPIIRGMDGGRVKILMNGTEIMDASTVSHDHNVTTEPMLAEKIEVLKGPSSLAYGAGAIGGVINVVDNKVPSYIPENGYEGFTTLQYDTAARGITYAGSFTTHIKKLAFHLEGLQKKAENYRTGKGWHYYVPYMVVDKEHGYLESVAYKAQPMFRVPITFSNRDNYSLGTSWIDDFGYIGFAYTNQHFAYGIPGHGHPFDTCTINDIKTQLICTPPDHVHDHNTPKLMPNIDMLSKRWDVRGEIKTQTDFLEKITFNGSTTKYIHTEAHGKAIGTTFKNNGKDIRLAFHHQPISGIKGALGLQYSDRNFSVSGAEGEFINPNRTTKYGIYWIGEHKLYDSLTVDGGMRFDHQKTSTEFNPIYDAYYPNAFPTRTHYSLSSNLGLHWKYQPDHSINLSLSSVNRAPTAEELYAKGVHIASSTWELGDPFLKNENSNNIDLTFRGANDNTNYEVNVFYNIINNYIYAKTLDYVKEEGPLLQYSQANAEFIGIEASLHQQLNNLLGFGLFGDHVYAKLKNSSEKLPRIPASRIGASVDLTYANFNGKIELVNHLSQNRIAKFETKTPGYSMLNAQLSYKVILDKADMDFYLKGENLTNKLAYTHTSLIKEKAPLTGCNISLGIKVDF